MMMDGQGRTDGHGGSLVSPVELRRVMRMIHNDRHIHARQHVVSCHEERIEIRGSAVVVYGDTITWSM